MQKQKYNKYDTNANTAKHKCNKMQLKQNANTNTTKSKALSPYRTSGS